jgi:hypothetical protein
VRWDVGVRRLLLSDVVCVWLVADVRVFTAAVGMVQALVKV